MDATITGHGPTQMQDQDLCIAVGEDLTRMYPGYAWAVGCNHEAGVLYLDLMADKPPFVMVGGKMTKTDNMAMLLHIKTLVGPGGQHRVKLAGGEMLERYGLPRDRAPVDYRQRVETIDTGSMILKSRH